MIVGPFSSMDPLFPGVAADWQLYTAQEVMCLRSVGVLNPSATAGFSISTLLTLAPLAGMQSAPITSGVPKMDLGSPKLSRTHPPKDEKIEFFKEPKAPSLSGHREQHITGKVH